MTILLRTRLGPGVGFGHFVRQLALAEAFADRNQDCQVVLDTGTLQYIPQDMASIVPLAETDGDDDFLDMIKNAAAKAVVLDHYDFSFALERRIRLMGSPLAVLDDIPVRAHDCDLLVDQSLGREAREYDGLVQSQCILLCGQDYALLRPAYAKIRQAKPLPVSFPPQRILILGGSQNQTGLINQGIPALSRIWPKACLVIVTGNTPQFSDGIKTLVDRHPGQVEWLRNVADMAGLMQTCDFVIGAGGVELLERSVLGLPSVTVQTADNQAGNCRGALAANASVVLKDGPSLTGKLLSVLQDLDEGTMRRQQLSAHALCDGQGAGRVADAICHL